MKLGRYLIGMNKVSFKRVYNLILIQEKSKTTVRNVKIVMWCNSDVTNPITSSTCKEKENTMEKE